MYKNARAFFLFSVFVSPPLSLALYFRAFLRHYGLRGSNGVIMSSPSRPAGLMTRAIVLRALFAIRTKFALFLNCCFANCAKKSSNDNCDGVRSVFEFDDLVLEHIRLHWRSSRLNMCSSSREVLRTSKCSKISKLRVAKSN